VEGGSGRRGEREEDEIADLYQRTLSIRPKLVELIGKYSQKKGTSLIAITLLLT
jgi:signal transducing adaptor molecule